MWLRVLLPLSIFLLSSLQAKAADCGVNFDRSVKITVESATESYPRVVLVHKGAKLRIGPDSVSPVLCIGEIEFFSVALSSKKDRSYFEYILVQVGERRGWVNEGSIADYGRANVEELEAIASYSSSEIELPFVQTDVSTHTVKPQETLSSIAKKYGLSAADLALLNQLASSNVSVSEGQQLKVVVPTLPRAKSQFIPTLEKKPKAKNKTASQVNRSREPEKKNEEIIATGAIYWVLR